jgi:hypothetical protein
MPLTREMSVVKLSVTPSAKYSCSGSPPLLAKGKTTVERRGGPALLPSDTSGGDVDHAALHFDHAAHCVDHAAKLDEAAIAGALDDAPVMHGDDRIEEVTT